MAKNTYLQDSSNGMWLMSVDTLGRVVFTKNSLIPYVFNLLILNDAAGNSWMINVSTIGLWQATPTTNGNYPTTISIGFYNVGVATSGDWTTTFAVNAQGDYVLVALA